jgi:hypothetical protein
VAVAALKGTVGSHQGKARRIVVEGGNAPGRRPVALIAITAERAPVKICVAGRAISVGCPEALSLVALDARHILVKPEEPRFRMSEFDVGEW